MPHTPASATRTDSSGSQRSRQVSRNVPVLPRDAAGSPQLDAEQPQPVQQPAAPGVGLLAQVELQLPLLRLRFEPQRALEPVEVALQRHGGRRRRAPRPARRRRPAGRGRARAARPSPRTSRPGPRRWSRSGPAAGGPRIAASVSASRTASMTCAEETSRSSSRSSPATFVIQRSTGGRRRRTDARTSRASRCPRRSRSAADEPAVRPGHPGHLGLDLGQPLEQRPVGGDGGPLPQRGHVPGPAHHGHVVPELPLRGPHLEPHVRLAHEVPLVSPVPYASRSAPIASPSASNGANASPSLAAPVLDDVLPPALGVVVPGGLGEHGERVDPHGLRGLGRESPRLPLARPLASPVSRPRLSPGRPSPSRPHARVCAAGRSMKRAGTPCSSAQRMRDPLRGELGERPERRPARLVHGMGEERDRRPHALVGGQRDQRVGLGRPLDEHGARAAPPPARPARPGPSRARGAAPRAAGGPGPPPSRSLMRSPPGRRGRSPSSRRARGRPPPGTPAR